MKKIIKNGGQFEVASVGGGGLSKSTIGGITQSTSMLLGADLKDSMLKGLFDEKSQVQLQAVFRDIYLHDTIAGSAADLRSTLPWSEFRLLDCDVNQEKIFMDNLERLNILSLLPSASLDYMVSGAFLGIILYDPKIKGFTDTIPLNYSDCDISPTPLFSADPIITYNVSKELKEFSTSKSKAFKKVQDRVPPEILRAFKDNNSVELDPLSTLYIPRNTLTSNQGGISYFRRILPVYLLERVLFRGTVTEATRRQRSTLHITAGDEEWMPTEDELASLVGLFQSTESDPISSVVATRTNIQTQEIRPAGEFWKWTDVNEQLAVMKMRGLGINESFLAGDATYQNMETALTVFLEELINFRQRLTQEFFYRKLFPLISHLHGFKSKTVEKASMINSVFNTLNDTNQLLIPKIQWHKKLRPDADKDYI
jgi:hypothetical protein